MSPKTNNIALIFGAGPKVGASVTKKFLENSYKVLTVSRSDSINIPDTASHFHFKGDLLDTETVSKAFKKTNELFGDYPRVVIYNTGKTNRATAPKFEDALDISGEELNDCNIVNIVTPFLALKEAVKHFQTIEDNSKPKTFIYTGNFQNVVPFPMVFAAGVGKCGFHSVIEVAHLIYGKKYGYQFYYADERQADGFCANPTTNGPAAGEFYFELAEEEHPEIPYDATFVPGKGYTKF